jgi:hypothetical protein
MHPAIRSYYYNNGSPAFPLSFGENAIWINGTSSDGKTLSGPFSATVDSLVTNDVNALSFTSIAGLTNKMRFSGKWLHSPTLAAYKLHGSLHTMEQTGTTSVE